MIRKLLAATLLAITPISARAVCTPLLTGLQLQIPNFNDAGDVWSACLNYDLNILNSSSSVNGSTATIARFGQLAVSTITGNATGGIAFTSSTVFSAPLGVTGNNITITNGDLIFSTTSGNHGIRFQDGSFLNSALSTATATGNVWIQDDFTNLVTSTRVAFGFSNTPFSLPGVFVIRNGLTMRQGDDYVITSTGLTMAVAPSSGTTSFYVAYSTGGLGEQGIGGGGGGASGVLANSSATFTGNITFTNPIHIATRAADPGAGYSEGALYANTGDNRLHLFINGQWRIQRDSSQSQVFTSNGTFNVPSGVSLVWLTACAAGGGGGGSGGGTSPSSGGGGGESLVSWPVNVTGGGTVAVTVGSGGAGGTIGTPNGAAGGSTSFSGISLSGGSGGFGNGSANPGGAGGGNYGGVSIVNSSGTVIFPYIGGAAGGKASPGTIGGRVGNFSGGAASGDNGGGGASAFASGGAAATGGTGSAGGRCAGGGGAGGAGTTGGAGGGGQVIVEWIGP